MAFCCVPYCHSSKGKNMPGISFYEFPPEPKTRRRWLEAVSCTNFKPQGASSTTVVCCLHFKPGDFRNSGRRRHLRRGAVPTVFPGEHPFPDEITDAKRMRIKKTHGPDFVENLDSPTMDTTESCDGDEPLCFICGLSGAANPNGDSEALLMCRDCSAKAHPSCLNYTPEVAAAARLSSWQCVDCKMCILCGGNNDAEEVLVCDACDKGFHINCHRPKVAQKPLGKWLCKECCDVMQWKTPTKPKTDVDPAAGLPTPCDSPVPEDELKASEAERNAEMSLYFSSLDRYPDVVPDAKDWSVREVEQFLVHVGFPEQAHAFKEQEIDGRSLLLMKRSDVLMGMSIKLGPALKIYNHIKRLQTGLPNGHLL